MFLALTDIKSKLFLKNCFIDNTTFRLHYQITVALLVLASLLQSAKQYFGDPIICDVQGNVPQELFETYCWIHGTFTLPYQLTGRQGKTFAHPGVGPYIFDDIPGEMSVEEEKKKDKDLIDVTDDGDEIRHAWYQWVVFALLLQAVMCYLPHFIWKRMEGGQIRALLQDLYLPRINTEEESHRTQRNLIANYIHRNMKKHNIYAGKFVLCEFLNLVNVSFQLYAMDLFFNGHFSTYGTEVLSISNRDAETRADPMAKVFPKMSKCTFHKYGPSGTIQNLDGLCVLPLNIINEKIYVMLWFWFIFLITWTAVFFIFRLITVFSLQSRYLVFCGRAKSARREDVAVIMEKLWFGDWFLLMQICKNVHPEIFNELVIDLRNRVDPKLSANLEMRSETNPYPTLPMMERPQAPYMETP